MRILTTIGFFFLIIAVALYGADPTAYVLNTNSETVSKIDLETGMVTNNIFLVGTTDLCWPNQMIIRDTMMYLVVSGTDELQVVNLNNETTVDFIDMPDFSNPYWMEFSDDQYLYISLMMNNSLAKVDYTGKTVTDEIPVGKSPEGVLICDNKVYVACTGFNFDTYLYDPGEVYVIDMSTDAIVDQIAVGLNPQYMALDTLGRIHVVCTGDFFSTFGSVYIIDPSNGIVVDSVEIGGTPGQISIGPDNVAYIAASGWTEDGYVLSYNALTGEIYHSDSNPIEVDLNCNVVQAYQDSSIYTGSFTDYINVIDSSGTYQASYPVGDGPQHMVFNYIPGDANGDFSVNILDVTNIINWLYKGGEPPLWPRWRANADANSNFNILDVTYIIGYLYKGGDRPKVSPGWVY